MMLSELSHYVDEAGSVPGESPLVRLENAGPVDHRAAVAHLIRARQERARHLPADWFSNPAWDILVFLYDTHLKGVDVTVGDVGNGTGTRPTTTIRWLEIIEGDWLVNRRRCTTDTRRVFVSLSETGVKKMAAYFDGLALLG